ncbi:MAG: glycosyltransferase family 2 protein, partial [Pseudonocardiaceae bacterium]
LDALASWDRVGVPVTAVRTRRGLNHQRNVGGQTARGDFIAFCDADDEADDGWLDALARAARTADVIGGVHEFDRLNLPPIRAWRDDSVPQELVLKHEFLPAIPGGNCGMWRDVALAVRWDEQFGFGSSDIEFSWRAQLSSYRLAFAPDVVMHIRWRATLRGLAYQSFRYGHSGARLYRVFRHHGMSRTPRDEWIGEWWWLITHRHHLRRGGVARARWIQTAAFRLGRLVGSVGARVVFP